MESIPVSSRAVKSLAEQPEMGRPGRVPGTRELVVCDTPFVALYRAVRSEIEILRILHGARDWPKSYLFHNVRKPLECAPEIQSHT